MECDFLIVGAGPAGLACAQSLRVTFPAAKTIVIDSGKSVRHRDHENAVDIACGVGGAGLYSDGKFSFFPSGTDIWRHPYHLLSNAEKAREVQQILGPVRVKVFGFTEPQETLEEIVRSKCAQAYNSGAGFGRVALLVEDTSLEFEALNGMPGPYVKDFWQLLGSAGLARMLDGFESRRATARCMFALMNEGNIELYEGRLEGTIATAPRGTNGFGWDDIFVPDGHTLTLAEMPAHLKNMLSHRRQALVSGRRAMLRD